MKKLVTRKVSNGKSKRQNSTVGFTLFAVESLRSYFLMKIERRNLLTYDSNKTKSSNLNMKLEMLLIRLIKFSVNRTFNETDIIRFMGEYVKAKETLTNIWINDLYTMTSLRSKLLFSFTRFKESQYFKGKMDAEKEDSRVMSDIQVATNH